MEAKAKKTDGALHYVLETKGISHDEPKLRKIYIIETNIVSLSSLARVMKKKGN